MIRLDWTINVLDILSLIVVLGGFHIANIRRNTRIETKVDMMYSWFRANIIRGGDAQ